MSVSSCSSRLRSFSRSAHRRVNPRIRGLPILSARTNTGVPRPSRVLCERAGGEAAVVFGTPRTYSSPILRSPDAKAALFPALTPTNRNHLTFSIHISWYTQNRHVPRGTLLNSYRGGGGMAMSTLVTAPSDDSGLSKSAVLPTTSTASLSLCKYLVAARATSSLPTFSMPAR